LIKGTFKSKAVVRCLVITLDGHRKSKRREDEQNGEERKAEAGHCEVFVY
jgi:hypothetical protein